MGGGGANGGLGAKHPAAGGRGSEGKTPCAWQFLQYFNKNNAFLAIFILCLKFCFKTCSGKMKKDRISELGWVGISFMRHSFQKYCEVWALDNF